jgi:hypothetical protein
MSEIPGQSGHALPDFQHPLCADCVEKLKNEAARDFRETQIEIVLRELVALQ